MESTAAELLQGVRNYLDITWVDADGDKKLIGIISRGMKYLDGMAGKKMDYSAEDKARELLLEYCRYARVGLLANFMKDYLHELIAFQLGADSNEV